MAGDPTQPPDDAGDPLVRYLTEQWDEIQRHLTAQDRLDLAALADQGAQDPRRFPARLTDFLLDRLPVDHPVSIALRTTSKYSASPASTVRDHAALRRLAQRSGALPNPPDAGLLHTDPVLEEPGSSQTPTWQELHRRVVSRLLELPSLSPEELRARGGDPDAADLIRLPAPGAAARLPQFQFGADGRPLPVVVQVNHILDAEHDPWGVTCWWVDAHARFQASPADLLGTGQDSVLVEAALSLVED